MTKWKGRNWTKKKRWQTKKKKKKERERERERRNRPIIIERRGHWRVTVVAARWPLRAVMATRFVLFFFLTFLTFFQRRYFIIRSQLRPTENKEEEEEEEETQWKHQQKRNGRRKKKEKRVRNKRATLRPVGYCVFTEFLLPIRKVLPSFTGFSMVLDYFLRLTYIYLVIPSFT